MTRRASGRWAWAEIDLGAIAHNVAVLRGIVAPADVWAVVKADGYGHGAARVAERALAGGAAGLCVALVEEGVELRQAGIEAPILLLSQQPVDELADVVAARLIATVYTIDYAAALAALAPPGYPVHVKLDTGMQRVGAPWDGAGRLLQALARDALTLSVQGVFTHLAVADEPGHSATPIQLERFDAALADLDRLALRPPLVHAANSGGALAWPLARHSFVRAGIATYGISPGHDLDDRAAELRPVMSLKARVGFVKRVARGSFVSYGWRHEFADDTTVATVPIGYADGVPRRLGSRPDRPGFDVLIGGRRCPIVGVVTMDQLMVDVGHADVQVGDEVVLIGRQGRAEIRAEHWADHLDTIGYEVVCGISKRVPREYVG